MLATAWSKTLVTSSTSASSRVCKWMVTPEVLVVPSVTTIEPP